MPELSPEEARRQADILWPIRLRHHSELGRLGIADRVFRAPTKMNTIRPQGPYSESTLLYPARNPLDGNYGQEELIEFNEPRIGALLARHRKKFEPGETYGFI